MLKDGLSLKTLNYLESLFYKNAWFITGQSNEIVNKIKIKEPNTIVYKLSNGVDVKKYKSSIKKLVKNKLIKKNIQLFMLDCMVAQGLDQLLKVASLAQQYNDNFQFILIGDGPEKSNLLEDQKAKIEKCRIRDPLDREKIPVILSNSDIAIIH